MREKEFKKKYKGIKMHKFVPRLENELKDSIRRRQDWTMTALDCEEKYQSGKPERRVIFFLQTALTCFLCFLLVMFNLYIIRGFIRW